MMTSGGRLNAAQNPAQPITATVRHDHTAIGKPKSGNGLWHNAANADQLWRVGKVPPAGLEQTAFFPENSGDAEQGGAESGALSDGSDIGGALAQWLDACPMALDDEIKAGILAIIRAAGTGVDCARR